MNNMAKQRLAIITTPEEREMLDKIEALFPDDPDIFNDLLDDLVFKPASIRLKFLQDIHEKYSKIPGK